MKKLIKLLAAIIVIYFITATAPPKLLPAAAQETHSDLEEFFQTWNEFIESGVKIEYGEAIPVSDFINYK